MKQVKQPHLVNPEAERALLGRIIGNETVWLDVCDQLAPDDFGLREHVATFEGMMALWRASKPIGVVTLVSQIKSSNEGYDEKSIGFRLSSISAEAERSEFRDIETRQLISIIKHRSICRQLISASEEIQLTASGAALDTPIESILSDAAKLVDITSSESSDGVERIGDLAANVIRTAEDARIAGKPVGLRVKLRTLDDLLGPVLPTNLIILAGETGSGKTALATEVGFGWAEGGIPGYMFSLEMDGAELAIRTIAREAEIASQLISDGRVTAADTAKMMEAGSRVIDLPFWIDSRPQPTVPMMMARLSRAIKTHGVRWAIIDHLQYVRPDSTKGRENEQIKQVVDDIKGMAKRLRIPIILLSHVTRQSDFNLINVAADIRRPLMSSLYGSSAIEKAADGVIFVHRPIWFLQQVNPTEKKIEQHAKDMARWMGKAEFVMPKLRGGKPFRSRVCLFDEERTWFSDLPNFEPSPM